MNMLVLHIFAAKSVIKLELGRDSGGDAVHDCEVATSGAKDLQKIVRTSYK
jgi:hypothetical protein